jgi:dienelactone hydrolase
MKLALAFIFSIIFFISEAQEKVYFNAADGLQITADLYETSKDNPYVLLFHQAGYSRGEYKQTAEKIIKFGYNCLAVDLRSGGEVNYIQNHTALVAIQQGYKADYLSSQQDILAAIKWVKERSEDPVILFGSSFSASLALLIAKDNQDVKAVIAFSPGEFFKPQLNIQSQLSGLNKPVFAAASKRETDYVNEVLKSVPSENKTIFTPKEGGEHGSKSLWKSNPNNKEYWLALTMFFSKIRHL